MSRLKINRVYTMPDPPELYESLNFVSMYDKYKNGTSSRYRLKFAILHLMKNSPYYDEKKGLQLIEDLGRDDPVAYFHMFMNKMIMSEYSEAFEYFKLYDPHLLENIDSPSELRNSYFIYSSAYVSFFDKEIKYFTEISCNWDTRYCDKCYHGQFCIHRKINNHDVWVLENIKKAKYEKAELEKRGV